MCAQTPREPLTGAHPLMMRRTICLSCQCAKRAPGTRALRETPCPGKALPEADKNSTAKWVCRDRFERWMR